MKNYFIETWGCQMNLHDSERLEGHLQRLGLDRADRAEGADLVLLNTCSVREKPVHKLVSRIGDLAKHSPESVIGVCGCVAQQEGEALIGRGKVGFVLGPGQIERVGEALAAIENGGKLVLTGFDPETEFNFHTIFRKSSTKGMVTVIEGCNEFCTFCIVPYTRGMEVNRRKEKILIEVRALVEAGIPEIELLGQTVNDYRCPDTGANFAQLLDEIASIDKLPRLRFLTSHPRHFSDELIAVMAKHRHMSRYLHLPFQSGSNEILKKMRRRYTREDYIELIGRIRTAIPDINMSTDIIVGFPGESEENFQETLELMRELRFGQIFAFAYSPRPKTPASRYPGQLSKEIKHERLHRLFALSEEITCELYEALIGTTVCVLIDGSSRRSDEHWQGRDDGNRLVNFAKTGREQVGEIVAVEILAASAHSLKGRIIDREPPPSIELGETEARNL